MAYPSLQLPADRDAFLTTWRSWALEIFAEKVYGPAPEAELPLSVRSIDRGELTGGTWRVLGLEVPQGEVPVMVVEPTVQTKATAIGLTFPPLPEVTRFAIPGSDSGPGDKAPSWDIEAFVADGWRMILSPYEAWRPDTPTVVRDLRAINEWAWAYRILRRWDSGAGPYVAVGHSRLGKAALWASANDPGFAGCACIQSGCGGAAPNRADVGERIEDITRNFPHWFVDRYRDWVGREEQMDWDQHVLLALMSPRALFLPNADDDQWANPDGQERLAGAAREAWARFGDPAHLGTWRRPGVHEVTPSDLSAIRSFFAGALGLR